MEREVTVKYSPEIVKFAVWKFWTRFFGFGGSVAFFVLCIAFLVVLLSGDRSWLLGFMGAAVLVCLFALISTYRVCLTRSMDKLQKMGQPTARFRFTDDFLAVESEGGKSELPWTAIKDIWKYPTVWLMFIDKQNYMTLPIESFDETLQKFITQKVNQSSAPNN